MSMPRVPVLMYHAVEQNRSVIAIAPAVFAWQMQWLHNNGLHVMPLSELVGCLRNKTPLPPRSLVITFDDGFESVYTQAFPILKRHEFPATVFVIPGYTDGNNDWPGQPSSVPHRPLLTWAQIGEMDRAGIEFGAHSYSHPRLDRLSHDEVAHELVSGRDCIQEHLGHAVTLFAYPYGRYDDSIRTAVGDTYLGACSTRPGLVDAHSDPLAIERVEVAYVEQRFLFRALAKPIFSPYLGLRRMLRTLASTILKRPWA
jgi:peptidoglycan/xylan/chitin deacetylase (PgdA/CDA1 family)